MILQPLFVRVVAELGCRDAKTIIKPLRSKLVQYGFGFAPSSAYISEIFDRP